MYIIYIHINDHSNSNLLLRLQIHIIKEKTSIINNSEFKCHYLNAISISGYTSDIEIAQLLSGPDTKNVRSRIWNFISSNFPNINTPTIPIRSNHSNNISTKGATLVIIKTHRHTLHKHKKLRKKLIPHPEDLFNIDGSSSFPLRFILSNWANPFIEGNIPQSFLHDESIKTQCYDLSKYPHGIIFAFQECNDITTTSTTNIILQKNMSHLEIYKEFKVIVLSQWVHMSPCVSITNDIIQLFQKTYNHGHGPRSCTDSDGFNLYQGKKETWRTLASPGTKQDDLYNSQRYKKEYTDATLPICCHILNHLVREACSLMRSLNKVYHDFLWDVWKVKYPDKKNRTLITRLRNFCKLSILTFGTRQTRLHSFVNTPHVDTTDNYDMTTGNLAFRLLKDKLKQDPNYSNTFGYTFELLKILGQSSFKLAVPTVCGYDIIKGENDDNSTENYHSFFSLVGLDVSVKITPHVYHYFFASSFTHCTPSTMYVNSSNQTCTLYKEGGATIVGWGGSGGTGPADRTTSNETSDSRAEKNRRRDMLNNRN